MINININVAYTNKTILKHMRLWTTVMPADFMTSLTSKTFSHLTEAVGAYVPELGTEEVLGPVDRTLADLTGHGERLLVEFTDDRIDVSNL